MVLSVAAFATMGILVWNKNKNQDSTYLVDLSKPAMLHVVKNVNTNEDVNTNSSTNGNVNSSVNTNASTEAKESTDVVDQKNPSVHTYTSYKLGVQFNYWSDSEQPAAVLEQGSKIYVYWNGTKGKTVPTEGQWLEVFSKKTTKTLQQAVTDAFLKDYSSKDCYATAGTGVNGTKSTTGVAAVINFPALSNGNDPWWANGDKCPATYSLTNGLSYFWTSSDTSTKYVFYSIGQYAIRGADKSTPWQESVRFIDTTSSDTLGWKTYTNNQYHFSFQYPSDWKLVDNKFDASVDNPLSSDYVWVKDPSNDDISLMVCPDDRGNDCSPFQDAEWSTETMTQTVAGQLGVETDYTVKTGQNCSSCTRRSTIILNARPKDWKGGRDFLLRSGTDGSTIPSHILSTFQFTK